MLPSGLPGTPAQRATARSLGARTHQAPHLTHSFNISDYYLGETYNPGGGPVADYHPAIIRALQDMDAAGPLVTGAYQIFFPPGTFDFSKTIQVNRTSLHFVASGGTTLRAAPGKTCIRTMHAKDPSNAYQNVLSASRDSSGTTTLTFGYAVTSATRAAGSTTINVSGTLSPRYGGSGAWEVGGIFYLVSTDAHFPSGNYVITGLTASSVTFADLNSPASSSGNPGSGVASILLTDFLDSDAGHAYDVGQEFYLTGNGNFASGFKTVVTRAVNTLTYADPGSVQSSSNIGSADHTISGGFGFQMNGFTLTQQGGDGGNMGAHGIEMRAGGDVRHCAINGFSGHGIAVVGGVPFANNNGWGPIEANFISSNRGHGLILVGSDANAGSSRLNSFSANGGTALYEGSFLGSNYHGHNQQDFDAYASSLYNITKVSRANGKTRLKVSAPIGLRQIALADGTGNTFSVASDILKSFFQNSGDTTGWHVFDYYGPQFGAVTNTRIDIRAGHDPAANSGLGEGTDIQKGANQAGSDVCTENKYSIHVVKPGNSDGVIEFREQDYPIITATGDGTYTYLSIGLSKVRSGKISIPVGSGQTYRIKVSGSASVNLPDGTYVAVDKTDEVVDGNGVITALATLKIQNAVSFSSEFIIATLTHPDITPAILDDGTGGAAATGTIALLVGNYRAEGSLNESVFESCYTEDNGLGNYAGLGKSIVIGGTGASSNDARKIPDGGNSGSLLTTIATVEINNMKRQRFVADGALALRVGSDGFFQAIADNHRFAAKRAATTVAPNFDSHLADLYDATYRGSADSGGFAELYAPTASVDVDSIGQGIWQIRDFAAGKSVFGYSTGNTKNIAGNVPAFLSDMQPGQFFVFHGLFLGNGRLGNALYGKLKLEQAEIDLGGVGPPGPPIYSGADVPHFGGTWNLTANGAVNNGLQAGLPIAWMCTAGGTPGTWITGPAFPNNTSSGYVAGDSAPHTVMSYAHSSRPVISGNFTAKVYYTIDVAATTIAIVLSYTSARGVQSVVLGTGTKAVGDFSAEFSINSVAGNNITITAQSDKANSLKTFNCLVTE